ASSSRSSRRSRAARQRLRGWRRSCAIGRAPRSSRRSASPISHVAPILPAHLIERVRNLPERADLDGLHELGEHVPAAGGELLERLQRRGRARRVARLEGTHRRHLSLLLFLARADQLRALVLIERVGSREEGVDADDRQRAIVLARLVVERLLLDLAALIHALHGAEHAAALRELLELLIDRLLHQLRQVLDGERALPRVLDLVEAELAIDDELNRDRAPYALLGRRGERLVVGIGVQAVAVVEQRIEGLQRR